MLPSPFPSKEIKDSDFSHNDGDGLFADNVNLHVENSTFSHNKGNGATLLGGQVRAEDLRAGFNGISGVYGGGVPSRSQMWSKTTPGLQATTRRATTPAHVGAARRFEFCHGRPPTLRERPGLEAVHRPAMAQHYVGCCRGAWGGDPTWLPVGYRPIAAPPAGHSDRSYSWPGGCPQSAPGKLRRRWSSCSHHSCPGIGTVPEQ
jgi:hypothetical protein